MKNLLISLAIPLFLFCSKDKSIVGPKDEAVGIILFTAPSTEQALEIWSILDNGKELLKLSGGAEVDVSPDNQYIVFTSSDSSSKGVDIFKMKPDGTDKICLTSDLDFSASYPRWSPDGSKISFQAGPNCSMDDVWIMNSDGSNKIKLTDGNASSPHWSPEWSNDGTRLSFLKSTKIVLSDSSFEWDEELWLLTLDGHQEKLIDLERPNSSGKWSPDDKNIAIISNGNVHIIQNKTAIWANNGYVAAFCWTDTGALVYCEYNNGANLYRKTGESEPEKLTNFNAQETIGSLWICHDSSIVFVVNDNKIFKTANGKEQLLVDLPSFSNIYEIRWIALK